MIIISSRVYWSGPLQHPQRLYCLFTVLPAAKILRRHQEFPAALGACTSMTVRMYAKRKQWPVEDVKVLLSHTRQHGEDCIQCDAENRKVEIITRALTIKGDLSATQRERLLEIADRCPVHKTLNGKLVIETKLEGAQ